MLGDVLVSGGVMVLMIFSDGCKWVLLFSDSVFIVCSDSMLLVLFSVLVLKWNIMLLVMVVVFCLVVIGLNIGVVLKVVLDEVIVFVVLLIDGVVVFLSICGVLDSDYCGVLE